MKTCTAAALLLTTILAGVSCDTSGGHVASIVQPSSSDNLVSSSGQYQEQTNFVQDPNLYYNNYASDPYGNGYYDYDTQDASLFPSQEADRQDLGLGAGLTLAGLAPVFTVMFAAMAGSLMAPAVSTAGRALFDAVMQIPEIEINLPSFGSDEETAEVRSLNTNSNMWSRIMTNVANNLAEEFNRNYKGKFQKLLNKKVL